MYLGYIGGLYIYIYVCVYVLSVSMCVYIYMYINVYVCINIIYVYMYICMYVYLYPTEENRSLKIEWSLHLKQFLAGEKDPRCIASELNLSNLTLDELWGLRLTQYVCLLLS